MKENAIIKNLEDNKVMLPQDRIEQYGTKPIEERAKIYSEMASDNLSYQRQIEVGYLNGATEQRMIDIDKACKWLRSNHENLEYINIDGDLFDISLIEDFRKAMEEE